MTDLESLRNDLAEILPKSQHKKIDRILELVDPGSRTVEAVDVLKSRAGVERVSAYGLIITLDANGDASAVEFPYGAEVAS